MFFKNRYSTVSAFPNNRYMQVFCIIRGALKLSDK